MKCQEKTKHLDGEIFFKYTVHFGGDKKGAAEATPEKFTESTINTVAYFVRIDSQSSQVDNCLTLLTTAIVSPDNLLKLIEILVFSSLTITLSNFSIMLILPVTFICFVRKILFWYNTFFSK